MVRKRTSGDLFDFPTGQGDVGGGDAPVDDVRAESDSGELQGDLFAGAEPLDHDPKEFWSDEPLPADNEPAAPGPAAAHADVDSDDAYQAVGAEDSLRPGVVDQGAGAPDPTVPTLGARWLGGAVDVVIHGAVAALGVGALLRLGLTPSMKLWPGFVAFLLCFSFLYVTLPLAFWGQTPGMAWSGLRAHDRDGRSLTFIQAVVRWMAAVFSTAFLGLPLVLAASGRSLADRMSGSETTALVDDLAEQQPS